MDGMLSGIKVLDLTVNAAGPTAAAMFADYGADVIKIERPKVGADERSFTPLQGGKSLAGAWLDRGKKSITLDLKDPAAVAAVKRLVADTDVLVESNRPGVMKKLGLDYETLAPLNPRLVYCSISAFGQTGPYAQKGGYDLLAQGMSGMMDITGEKSGVPTKHGIALGDYIGGVGAFGSILAALIYQKKTGEGQYVDFSLLRGLVYMNSSVDSMNNDVCITRGGNHHYGLCPYGLFNGKGAQSINLAAFAPKMWIKLCEIMGSPQLVTDPRFDSNNKRCAIAHEVIEIIESWLQNFDDINDAVKLLDEAGIPCCKVNTNADVVKDPHIIGEQFLVEAPCPDDFPNRTYLARNCMAKFSKTPGFIKKAHQLGEDNDEVLSAVGYTKEEIDAMQSAWK